MEVERLCSGVSCAPVAEAFDLMVQTVVVTEKSVTWLLFLIGLIRNNADALSDLLEAEKSDEDEAEDNQPPFKKRIATRLGVFRRFPRRFLTLGPETRRYSIDDMRLAGMCPMDDPTRWEPTRPAPEGPPDVEALQRGLPSERQRILHRVERPQQTYPLREPRPTRITLEAVWETMERQSRVYRLIMAHLGIRIPDWFREPNPQQQPDGHDDEPRD
ncbi:hypothetical protein E3N88_23115 [Mikania micrantha]|uniref:Uncharacterized protein n=1 Tax=Mikania micrantha TaxID=192012 RepID=A0A5N6NCL4_9ASTR|nr:hypothetical protein E3N88_23115 [Mikania micrantha]